MTWANKVTVVLVSFGILALYQGSDLACMAYIVLVLSVLVWARIKIRNWIRKGD